MLKNWPPAAVYFERNIMFPPNISLQLQESQASQATPQWHLVNPQKMEFGAWLSSIISSCLRFQVVEIKLGQQTPVFLHYRPTCMDGRDWWARKMLSPDVWPISRWWSTLWDLDDLKVPQVFLMNQTPAPGTTIGNGRSPEIWVVGMSGTWVLEQRCCSTRPWCLNKHGIGYGRIHMATWIYVFVLYMYIYIYSTWLHKI